MLKVANPRTKLLRAVAVLAMLGVMPAKADDFFFSFANTTGNVPGTVTGEIFGLPSNGTNVAATDVQIFTAPSIPNIPLPLAPFDVFTTFATINVNSFDVSSGVVTRVNFQASTNGGEFVPFFGLCDDNTNCGNFGQLGYNIPPEYALPPHVPRLVQVYDDTFTAANLTPAPGPIPGAGLLSYIALGLLGLGSAGWKRWRLRSAVA